MVHKMLAGLVVGVAVLTGTIAAHAECTRMVISADPAYPPMHWYNGEVLQGASIEIAMRVLDDLKIPYEVRYLGPLPRVMAAAERGEIDLIATLKKTPEREEFLLYPKTAALSNPVSVFSAREHPLKFAVRDDLIGKKGGVTRGNQFGSDLDDYIKSKLSIEEANSPEHNFNKLALGRIDYFVTGYYTGIAILLKRGDEERFVAHSPFLVDTPNYLVLSKKGRCGDQRDRIDAQLAILKKTGVLDELIRKSFQKWKAKPILVDK
jgi:polar amino acid transport system substrate-binding protein